MQRKLCTLMLAAAIMVAAVFAVVSMQTTSRDAINGGLRGTLTLPEGAPAAVAVLILAGSGAVDRDGNLPGARNDSLKLLADGLAEAGIASLRVDKRGIGASLAGGTREEDLPFDTYVDDAVSWIAYLRARTGIDSIVLLGHSEGALVATLAAQRTEVASLVLVAGAGAPAPVGIERQLAAAGVPAELQAESRRIAESLSRGTRVSNVPPELSSLYRPSVQPYLMSWLSLDPAEQLRKVSAPILIVQGTTDLQVGVGDARQLAAALPRAKLVIIEGMNHVLKDAPAERTANIAAYTMQSPLSAALVPEIAGFVRSLPK